jgi:DNA-binding NarL/FixJ family response regulator
MGRRQEAEQQYQTARAIIEQLAANVPDDGLRSALMSATAAMLPRRPSPSPRQLEQQAYGGLTSREREVVAFVAQGKSNREIAESLIVGERTVEAHVSNILSKLGFASRAQIAAWAVERGLTAT